LKEQKGKCQNKYHLWGHKRIADCILWQPIAARASADTQNANCVVTLTIAVNGYAEYNQAIDDACFALKATGAPSESWDIVRSLREPKAEL